VTVLRWIVERHLRTFNERDFESWGEHLDEDVEFTVDAGSFRGLEAAQAYGAGSTQAYPGLQVELDRVVAESDDTIVVDLRFVNPAGDQPGAWHLGGTECEILKVRDGKVVALRSFYTPTDEDRTEAVNVPSRAEAARIAGEQAALRRVATLVARGVSHDELFAAVNHEVAQLVGADPMSMMRFEPDDTITLVAGWSAGDISFPIGARRPVDDTLRSLRETGRPFRWGPAELPLTGPFVDEARRLGIRSSIGVPIEVEGRVWGVTFASSTSDEPFADDTEARIAGFTELVATAIANAQARSELQRLVDEQQALRRVATLVAHGASESELFGAVAAEASELLGRAPTALLRYEPDDTASIVAIRRGRAAVGTSVPAVGDGLAARVRRTGRTARIDSYDDLGPEGAFARRELGLAATVGAPIAVSGRLWGLIVAMSQDEPLPAGTEERIAQFADLVATAIGNAESRAELTASRARVVATADETRRRIQRDVHDGAQQRLVHTVIMLKLAQAEHGDEGGRAAELVDEALAHAELANAELRELVHGIMPAALTGGGLRAGVESLADSINLPLSIDVPAERLPSGLATTAYFIVAEALTNAVKHADADSARVWAVVEDDVLHLEVSDDGVGGADPTRGSGLLGLTDRVAASGGSIQITSPPGEGTTIALDLPIEHGDRPDRAAPALERLGEIR
jgi:signal transduction histidine kinase/ketosteroid isomerase-like protein